MLKRVTLQSSGLYRCEVSGEAPAFNTVSESETMTVVGKSQLSECLMEFSLQKTEIAITDSVRKRRRKRERESMASVAEVRADLCRHGKNLIKMLIAAGRGKARVDNVVVKCLQLCVQHNCAGKS